ncbi:hypothetical protein DSCA_08400 [Desulfosarcina alkanivorans]|uniref:DUF5655 domain-containing protein n=1 Tax=Desulfosarcina alkanivorans TaxID=571177 RepID=A0A5K7YFT7_9BACT|nr:hypothetical protein [Desulfosarcina alkanivorans]BBO66910.1 hypothetical protein DSCA_08400 [Desulfosarcina alkanivorans]
MTGGIFLINKDETLVEMTEQAYDSEDVLQAMLEKHPNLLAGEQVDSDNPRRWLLISREMHVPGSEDTLGRFSLDHLFLDQDGIPTLVEVKRSSDTRIRREVVGQMLDYAANAVVYWPIELVMSKFEQTCEHRSTLPADLLATCLDPACDEETFWQKVKDNLRNGKIRLVFVADEIPAELKRIIEFLNEQMDPAEVLGIEIRQFTGEGLKTLVPRVIGQTQSAIQKKQGQSYKRIINQHEFLNNLNDGGLKAFNLIFETAKEKKLTVKWGTVGFSLNVRKEGLTIPVLYGYGPNAVHGQSVITSFYGQGSILKKLDCDESVISNKVTNDFSDLFAIQSGNDFKLSIGDHFSDDQASQLALWLEGMTDFISKTPLR